jgi:hypothetical protein
MMRSFWRQKKVRQNQLVEFQLELDASTTAVGGIDKAFVKSVTKLGTGVFKIVLKDIGFHNIQPTFLNVLPKDIVGHVAAVDKESITIATVDLAADPIDANVSFGALFHYDNRLY